MSQIGVEILPLTERNSRLPLGLYESKSNKGIKSEDKLDAVSNDYKRTKETA
jgi:hypothetical protein